MNKPARILLILLVLAIGGVSALGFLAQRYGRLVEAGAVVSSEELARQVEGFIAVRRAMRREIDSWSDAPRPRSLSLVRDRALMQHGLRPDDYTLSSAHRNFSDGEQCRYGGRVCKT